MKTILDIDIDFFFSPCFNGDVCKEPERAKKTISGMKQVVEVSNVIDKFNLTKNIPGKVFKRHNEIFNDVIAIAKNEKIHIVHLDAHHDLASLNKQNNNLLTEANIGTKLVERNIVHTYDWVHVNNIPDKLGKIYAHGDIIFHHNIVHFNNYNFSKNIDYILITLSPDWCPSNDIASDLIKHFK